MGVFRPVVILILIIILAVLGSYLVNTDQTAWGAVFYGTAVFLLLSAVAVYALMRLERRASQQRNAESRLLYFFRRWLMRVDGRVYQYMKFKVPQKDGVDDATTYLEDFSPAYLDELRKVLPEEYDLTEIGVMKRLDGQTVDPDRVLALLEDLGWDIYYIRQATYGQYYGYYYLKREVGKREFEN